MLFFAALQGHRAQNLSFCCLLGNVGIITKTIPPFTHLKIPRSLAANIRKPNPEP